MNKTAFIALGSNMGNSEQNIKEAVEALSRIPGVNTEKLSELYLTKPWGYERQPDFVNACVRINTFLSPEALLGVCLGIEAGMGRVREIKNGPRIIDLDLLLYEGESRDTRELILPHPRMAERDFVLMPLSDVSDKGFALGFDVEKAIKALQEKS